MLQKITESRYSKDITFEDPINHVEGIAGYKLMMAALRFLFKCNFIIHSVEATGRAEVTSKCEPFPPAFKSYAVGCV
jgi:hypothetical protein